MVIKKIIAVILLIGNIFLLTACNFTSKDIEQNEDVQTGSNSTEQLKENNFHGESVETDGKLDTIETDSWEYVVLDGITDEEAFLYDTTEEIRNIVSSKLQQLCDKITKEEQNDPNFYIEGKWFKYFIASEEYQTILELKDSALKPLYFIIYKSENQGIYEYICSYAMYEISGLKDLADDDIIWSTSKQFLDLFTEKIVEHRN